MYETLAARGIALSPKPFALGLRVEHPQALIDNIQYGQEYAAGALSWHVHELSNSINVMLLPLSFSGVIKASCCYPLSFSRSINVSCWQLVSYSKWFSVSCCALSAGDCMARSMHVWQALHL